MYLIIVNSDQAKEFVIDPITRRDFQSLSTEYKLRGNGDHLAIAFANNDAERDQLADSFTRQFPGQDIGVYKMTKLLHRPAGDVIVREVSEKGILPA